MVSKPASESTPASASSAPEDSIGQRIAEKRTAKGLTHDGLSKLTKLFDEPSKAGIGRTTIRGYELGQYKPGTREIRLLCEALEVSPTWLILGETADVQGRHPGDVTPTRLPQTELQRFLVALSLLRIVDAKDRNTLYDLLHSLARLKLGENDYRTAILVPTEFGALLSDLWRDMKDGHPIDREKVTAAVKGYLPMLGDLELDQITTSLGSMLLSESN